MNSSVTATEMLKVLSSSGLILAVMNSSISGMVHAQDGHVGAGSLAAEFGHFGREIVKTDKRNGSAGLTLS